MAGLSSSRDDEHDSGGRGFGILVWTLLLVLAVGATGVLVFSSDARLLRLAVVGALWAALIGAFAAARYRRTVTQRDEAAEDLRTVYELELEREVAARREYELEVESETRRRLEDEVRSEVRDDLTALRGELRSMRENLEALLGGEVLVERVALRAESTRMRSLSEQPQRMLAAAREGRQRGIVAGSIGGALNGGRPANGAAASANGRQPAAAQASGQEAQTELMQAIAAKDWAESQRREALRADRRPEARPTRNEPVRPERNRREPTEQRPHSPSVARREAPQPEQQPESVPSAAASRGNLAASLAAAPRRPVPERAEQPRPAPTWDQDSASLDEVFGDRQPLAARRDAGASRQDLPWVAAPVARASQPRSTEATRWDGPVDHSHRPNVESVQPAPTRHAPEPEDAGAHASGRSVSDLLAAHGNAESPRRRRRRAEG